MLGRWVICPSNPVTHRIILKIFVIQFQQLLFCKAALSIDWVFLGSGYADYVYELIEENKSIGYSTLYRLGFQFETSLRRLPMEEEPSIINRLIQGYMN